MPTTSNRAYASPAHGGAVDTWDADLNAIFNQIDQNFGAVASVALSSSSVVLNAAQYVCGTIRFSGTLTGSLTITFPPVAGWWTIDNRLVDDGHYIVLQCGAGEIIGVPPHEATDILTDGTNVRYRNLGRVGSYLDLATAAVPLWITGSTIPPYLYCDGSAFNPATYPGLAALLGGSTLPDARGRYRGALDAGTNRITNAGSGINGNTLLAVGGAQNETIAQANLPNVNFNLSISDSRTLRTTNSVFSSGAAQGFAAGGVIAPSAIQQPVEYTGAGSIGGTAASGGSGTALVTMPPTLMGGITLIRAG